MGHWIERGIGGAEISGSGGGSAGILRADIRGSGAGGGSAGILCNCNGLSRTT